MLTKTLIVAGAAFAFAAATANPARAENAPGVTATEIRIGQTMPYSGPASAYSAIGRVETAYFKMINAAGGVNGRKIVLLSEDDGYNPAKTVEVTRKLVESDQVALVFNSLGTAANTAVEKYLNDHKVPQLFVASGGDKFGNYRDFPWTIGSLPSFRTEAQVYAKYILKTRPGARIAILYQNDDMGKDYVAGVKDVLGDRSKDMVVQEASYEPRDPAIDSQVIALQASGADTLLIGATPKFAAQALRKVYHLNWKPQIFLSNASASIAAVLEPVGLDKTIGVISSAYEKDPADPALADDPAMRRWREFMAAYLPEADRADGNYIYGYNFAMTLVQVLKQCGNDLSRENIMRQATNLKALELPLLLPGIVINTSATNYHPLRQLQLVRWNGTYWTRFGEILGDANS